MTLTRRLLAFGSLPLLSALAPLLLLPLISRVGGAAGWASILTAQAIGGFAGIVIMFGWSISGPARVARASSWEQRSAIYVASLRSRTTISLVLIPTSVLASLMTARTGHHADAAAMSFAMSLSGYSLAWFCIGMGRASWIARYEALPRMVATALSAILIVWTEQIWVYPALLAVFSVGGLLVFNRNRMDAWFPRSCDANAGVTKGLLGDWHAAFVSMSGSAYASAPLPIGTSSVDVREGASLASADKAYRYGLFAVIALANALQAWVLEAHTQSVWRRQLAAIWLHVVLGLIGFVALGLFGNPLTKFLFGSAVAAESSTSLWYGLAFLGLSISTPLVRNVLVPHGRTRTVLVATLTSAVLGILSMIMLSRRLGSEGVAIGFAMSEYLALALLLGPAVRMLFAMRREVRDAERGSQLRCAP